MTYQYLIDDPDPDTREKRRTAIDRALAGAGGDQGSQAAREREAVERLARLPR